MAVLRIGVSRSSFVTEPSCSAIFPSPYHLFIYTHDSFRCMFSSSPGNIISHAGGQPHCTREIRYSNKLDVQHCPEKVQLKTSGSVSHCVVLPIFTGITTSTFSRAFAGPLLTLSAPVALSFATKTSLSSIKFSTSLAQLLVASAKRRPRSSGRVLIVEHLEVPRFRFFDGLQSPAV
jgi:hypothetical protein